VTDPANPMRTHVPTLDQLRRMILETLEQVDRAEITAEALKQSTVKARLELAKWQLDRAYDLVREAMGK